MEFAIEIPPFATGYTPVYGISFEPADNITAHTEETCLQCFLVILKETL